MSDAMLAIGTRKGLFLARSADGGPFEVEPIQFSTVGVHLGGDRHARRHAPDPRRASSTATSALR